MRLLGYVRATLAPVVVVLLAGSISAGTISLRWDPLGGASGYRVHYGTTPGSYTSVRDVGSATSTTLTNLTNCSNYFIAVKAYNSQGESTSYSNEVVGWSRPEITSATPGIAKQGDRLTLTINGANFQPGAELDYDVVGLPTSLAGDPLVRVENVGVVSCNQVQAQLVIEPTAAGLRAMEVGAFTVNLDVVNPDTVFGASTTQLNVQFAEPRADVNDSDGVTSNRIDGKDLVWIAFSFGSGEGQPKHNSDADLNGDGFVDGEDLAFLATRFGGCWNGSGWSASACP
jgi:Fibronectin type III domain